MSKHGARVRVSLDKMPPGVQKLPREKQAAILQRVFKRACQDYGIMHMYKEHEFFVSKAEKRRRKKRQQMGEKRNTTTRYWNKEEWNE